MLPLLFAAIAAGDSVAPSVPRVATAWTDPDGSPAGSNTFTATGGTTGTVPAGSRLYIDLPFGVNGGVTVTARVLASHPLKGAGNAAVTVEFAPDGVTFTALGLLGSVECTGPGAQETFTQTFPGVIGGPASRVRLRLDVTENSGDASGRAVGTVFCTAGLFPANNYPVQYDAAA